MKYEVAELLADYINTAASGIEGDHVNNLTEKDYDYNNTVKVIRETFQTNPETG